MSPAIKCERCRRQFRQILPVPAGDILQDWYAPWPPGSGPVVAVAESDPDICEDCEADVFAACEAAGVA